MLMSVIVKISDTANILVFEHGFFRSCDALEYPRSNCRDAANVSRMEGKHTLSKRGPMHFTAPWHCKPAGCSSWKEWLIHCRSLCGEWSGPNEWVPCGRWKKCDEMSSNIKPSIDFPKLFFPNLQREYVPELLKRHGDFLLRRSGDGGRVLSVNSRGELFHFRFSDASNKTYTMEGRKFESLEAMITFYYQESKNWAGKNEVLLLTPIMNTVELIDYSRLKFVQELGRGNFGQVWRANLVPVMTLSWMSLMGSGEEVAVKILSQNASDTERAEFVDEARVMTGMQHENVVGLKGLSFCKQNENSPTKALIILEYCNLGSLDKLLHRDMVRRRGKQRSLVDAAKGLVYLHTSSIVHRDIAARNCLVHQAGEKFTVKISDFGLSRRVSTAYKMITKRRLPVFTTPPETLKSRTWTMAADVWSFGVLMQEVFSGGVNPYEKHYLSTPLKQIVTELSNGFRVPTPEGMPPGLAQLSLRCMSNPTDRPVMKDVLGELIRIVDTTPGPSEVTTMKTVIGS